MKYVTSGWCVCPAIPEEWQQNRAYKEGELESPAAIG
jgi:hypothetical protein